MGIELYNIPLGKLINYYSANTTNIKKSMDIIVAYNFNNSKIVYIIYIYTYTHIHRE